VEAESILVSSGKMFLFIYYFNPFIYPPNFILISSLELYDVKCLDRNKMYVPTPLSPWLGFLQLYRWLSW
jgi:hypothetical protein